MTTSCHFCGNAASLRFRAVDVNRATSDEAFAYYDCDACGALFLHPTPPDLGRYYPRDYYALPPTVAELARGAEAERYKIDLVRALVPGGRLLEIGPATGGFVYLAKEAGYDVTAIEMDARCCAWLGGEVGISVVCSDDPRRAVADMPPFDVIALWHVIEHVPEARALVAALAARLRPGGVLLMAAPNPESMQLRLFGPRWTHVDAPRHLHLLPISLLDRWAAEEGLRPALSTTTDEGSIGWNWFGWRATLLNMAPPSRVGASLAYRTARLCNAALAPLERSGRRGSTYTVAYRRPA
jgi:SAM-dependent methyltransferase